MPHVLLVNKEHLQPVLLSRSDPCEVEVHRARPSITNSATVPNNQEPPTPLQSGLQLLG